jgi:spermidine/putrescine transport system permease protein
MKNRTIVIETEEKKVGEERTLERFKRRIFSLTNLPSVIYLLILFYIPVAVLFGISFTKTIRYRIVWTITLENYIYVLTNPLYQKIFLNSLIIVTTAVAMLLLIGYPIAYYLARMNQKWGDKIILFMIIPVEINYLIRIFAWRTILGPVGILNSFMMNIGLIGEPIGFLFYSWFAVVIVTIHEWLPYVVIPLYVSLKGIPRSIYEAAYDLGASRVKTFLTITLPLSKAGFLSALFLVYIPTLGEFAIPALVGGTSGVMIGNLIDDAFMHQQDWSLGSAISFVLLGLSLLITALMVKILGYESLYQR